MNVADYMILNSFLLQLLKSLSDSESYRFLILISLEASSGGRSVGIVRLRTKDHGVFFHILEVKICGTIRFTILTNIEPMCG
jgi:hypothetical protein